MHTGHLSRSAGLLHRSSNLAYPAKTPLQVVCDPATANFVRLSGWPKLPSGPCSINEGKRLSVCFVHLSVGKLPVICYLDRDNWKIALDLHGSRGPKSCTGRLFQHAGVTRRGARMAGPAAASGARSISRKPAHRPEPTDQTGVRAIALASPSTEYRSGTSWGARNA